ncbi:SDR family NAD(P)-dependent oxidoreductase [Anoxynatronum buryatiense]|uniref:Meso-butanediol dehydrogenase / (S,S)-butanediol dehydrogenase / diacetyl reductase n=1 Tax=Anoxynatronum buryatiense TaxID=489973 RepID=A0AA46AJW5_9CLOT|nr:SDR family NAD(P)-dependent oxidoreductase [Anoxynatronum buryatiense]SMP63945.1 meso-butanediol dehydrogenase / (S,S)-butanediol dehydrogenase / diacetyl reductase [Anoxynatronum buryatiense]
MVPINLNGKSVLVTGAASGLGKAIAMRLAEAGCAVCVADINIAAAEVVANEISQMGNASMAFQVNTSNQNEVVNMVNESIKKFEKLDLLVNNAGIGTMKPITDMQQEDIDNMIDINLKGVIYGCKAALAHMIPQNEGNIINISSVAAKMGAPYASVYASSKAGVIALTNSLAREVAENNININAICPGIIRTNMWEKQLELMTNNGDAQSKNEAFRSFSSSQIPLRRPQEPEDIANMVVYLASDLARNITGQTINVDGGSAIF